MPRRSLCLIVNPSAGRGRAARLLPRVESALRARGMSFRVERTDSLPHARELARSALAAGEVAAAMGGDGLLGAIAGELRGSDGVLGVVPGGRGNDFARKLGIGPDPDRACDVLAGGREQAIDVAVAGDRTYLGIASAGFDSDCQDIANATKLPLGELVYVYATLRTLLTWRDARWQVVVDGRAHSFAGYAVAVANSGVFGGGMYLVPDASLDDGLLDVVLTRAATKRSYLAGLTKVFGGTHVDSPNLTFLRGREIAFHADRPFPVYADGDPIADLPVTIRVVPRALKVLVP
jgi:YegS/Rv2252/BmrU family lipid kinase